MMCRGVVIRCCLDHQHAHAWQPHFSGLERMLRNRERVHTLTRQFGVHTFPHISTLASCLAPGSRLTMCTIRTAARSRCTATRHSMWCCPSCRCERCGAAQQRVWGDLNGSQEQQSRGKQRVQGQHCRGTGTAQWSCKRWGTGHLRGRARQSDQQQLCARQNAGVEPHVNGCKGSLT